MLSWTRHSALLTTIPKGKIVRESSELLIGYDLTAKQSPQTINTPQSPERHLNPSRYCSHCEIFD